MMTLNPQKSEKDPTKLYTHTPQISVIQYKNYPCLMDCVLPLFLSGEAPREADLPNWNPPRLPIAGEEAVSPAPPAGSCSQGALAG